MLKNDFLVAKTGVDTAENEAEGVKLGHAQAVPKLYFFPKADKLGYLMINRASVQMWGIVGPSAGRPKWAGKKNDRVPAHAGGCVPAHTIRFYLHKEFRAAGIRFSLHKE